MEQIAHRLRSRLEVDTEFGSFLGDTRIRLLEAIARHGSISQAAKAVPLSYKAAWDAIDAMNNLADQPLVVRSTGGKNGGGTQLTEHGRKTVALYRALEAEYQAALDRLTESMNDGQPGDFAQFRQLLRRAFEFVLDRAQDVGHIAHAVDEGGDGIAPGECRASAGSVRCQKPMLGSYDGHIAVTYDLNPVQGTNDAATLDGLRAGSGAAPAPHPCAPRRGRRSREVECRDRPWARPRHGDQRPTFTVKWISAFLRSFPVRTMVSPQLYESAKPETLQLAVLISKSRSRLLSTRLISI